MRCKSRNSRINRTCESTAGHTGPHAALNHDDGCNSVLVWRVDSEMPSFVHFASSEAARSALRYSNRLTKKVKVEL